MIIGSGAGGGTMAHALAEQRRAHSHLERGDFVPQEERTGTPKPSGSTCGTRRASGGLTRSGREFRPYTHYCVGGNTKFWGSVLYRLRREDFHAVDHLEGVSPQWPIDYDTLAPYYERAERLYQVRGEHGIDPTEPRRGPYPYEPVPHSEGMGQIVEELRRMGLHPSPLPLGLLRPGESDGCILCNTCNSFACKLHAKSEADVVCVRPALRKPNVTLWTNTCARRLVTDAIRHPSGCGGRRSQRRAASASKRRSSSCRPVRSTPLRCCCGRQTTATWQVWPIRRDWSASATWRISRR